jgi:hypothetical protein
MATWKNNDFSAGIMTWDADNDARGVDGNAQWAYSLGIKSICKNAYHHRV